MDYSYSACLEGLDCRIIRVEVNMKRGIPRFFIVGLPATSIKEASERVRIAIENSGYNFPLQNILVNLSPAGSKKDGAWFDLSIAMNILRLSGQLNIYKDIEGWLVLGELGLDGSVKPMKGLISILLSLKSKKFHSVIVPIQNQYEASLIKHLNIFTITHLNELESILEGKNNPIKSQSSILFEKEELPEIELYNDQSIAMRAVSIAVAGKHHLFMVGSPGAGKTMIAGIAKKLLPPLSESEYLEILRIKSNTEFLVNENSIQSARPFRAPHHTASDISIVGGGRDMKMGEVTMAHNGILFLDELGEFKPAVIQALREPLEEGKITISRVNYHFTYPASFLLIAATNPCPCGFKDHYKKKCICSPVRLDKYYSRFSGPFMDRMDLVTELGNFREEERRTISTNLNEIYDDILKAYNIQRFRYSNESILFNGMVSGVDIDKYFKFNSNAQKTLSFMKRDPFYSIRKLNKIKRLSRTISDLEEEELIREEHLAEAIQLNQSEKKILKQAA